MSSRFLQYVLLLAVAYSQLFGGVSCCCFFRTILPDTVAKFDGTQEVDQIRAVQVKQSVPKCPRCAASRKSTVRKVDDADFMACQVSWSHECRCLKGLSTPAVQAKPIEFSDSVSFFSIPMSDLGAISIETRIGLLLPAAPIRFGEKSWQSIACIWNR